MDEKDLGDRLNDLELRLSSSSDSSAAALDKLLRLLPLFTAAQLLFAVPALIGSLALAYFAFVQADATRKMQVGGAMPFVTYGTSNVDDQGGREISLSLANNGLGPAILGPLEIRYEGKIIDSPADLLEQCCGLKPNSGLAFMTSPASNVAVRPGESVQFFRLKRTAQSSSTWDKLNEERWKLRVRACYCSIYNDCWIIEGAQTIPTPAAQCPSTWRAFSDGASR